MIELTINGQRRQLEPPGTVAGLLAAYKLNPALTVVERNGEIVPRSQYGTEPVQAGDAFELVQMMAGG